MKDKKPSKELYQQLRTLSCQELWAVEVPRFDKATPQERLQRVAVVRAVGVVFSESGTEEQKALVRPWLRSLLQDPCEKIRRYAMAAIPKIGAGVGEESDLISLLRTTDSSREKKFLGRALEKVGGSATLQELERESDSLFLQTQQKVKASLARAETPSTVRTDRVLSEIGGVRIHLRGRRGLERMAREEVEEKFAAKFRIQAVHDGLVVMKPLAPFSVGDIYALRCFGTVGFVLGSVVEAAEKRWVESLAALITSELSLRILRAFTEGSLRYRLDFVSKGHQRSIVRLVANRAYALCPEILNDARHARWTVAVYPGQRGYWVELCPKLAPDPRFAYRQQDVPAASHPPLAASLARLAGRVENEIVWDPFCGSGLELIERTLLGGVGKLYGSDRSAEAIAITEKNFAAAISAPVESQFICCDFRDFAAKAGLGLNSLTLIITNPPLGKRVPIRDLRGLIEDLFGEAARLLKPGGRLVLANPFRMESPQRALRLQSRRAVDFVGFDCFMERYIKG